MQKNPAPMKYIICEEKNIGKTVISKLKLSACKGGEVILTPTAALVVKSSSAGKKPLYTKSTIFGIRRNIIRGWKGLI